MAYECYVLSLKDRERIKEVFPFSFSRHLGDHITARFGYKEGEDMPDKDRAMFAVLGLMKTVDGLEALTVERLRSDGTSTLTRPDGKRYHITWSLDPTAFKPVDSNKLLQGEIKYTSYDGCREPIVIVCNREVRAF